VAKNPLFSTYRQGENRVTSSMLAVFERIDLSLLEALLAAAAGESSLHMVTFTNQPPGSGASVPDGRISARFAYWFEVKTARNALNRHQLEEHVANLESDATDERLFVITPDASQPEVIGSQGDSRVVWFSFAALSDAIDAALSDPSSTVSDQARFLLRELQALLVEDALLDSDDVVVVAARDAYPEYLGYAAYVCQPGRAFRDGLTHMAFYTHGVIQREVPRILYREDNVLFTDTEAARRQQRRGQDKRVGELIDALLATGPRQHGETFQVFLLSPTDDPQTTHLTRTIVNDTTTAAGRPWAWTMSQRYVTLARLTSGDVTKTSDLKQRS
jgi:hypothetical protein